MTCLFVCWSSLGRAEMLPVSVGTRTCCFLPYHPLPRPRKNTDPRRAAEATVISAGFPRPGKVTWIVCMRLVLQENVIGFGCFQVTSGLPATLRRRQQHLLLLGC
jgi:hypothetical protein